jgi:hypothetical protein
MSGAVISSNITTKVNGAISAAHTVSANCYAIVTYRCTSVPALSIGSVAAGINPFVVLYFGPGQSVPANYNNQIAAFHNTGTLLANYVLVSGIEFINSP